MWLFTSESFVSIVADRDNPENLLVRARVGDHLKALFPTAVVVETPNADYRYRATLDHKIVERVVAKQVASIGYDNFKDTVVDPDYHAACLRVWSAMHQLQVQQSAPWRLK
jgi:hypothetical protein